MSKRSQHNNMSQDEKSQDEKSQNEMSQDEMSQDEMGKDDMGKDEKQADPVETQPTAPEEDANRRSAPTATTASRPGSSLIPGLSLLLSLLACGAVAYLWWNERQPLENASATVDYTEQIRAVAEDSRRQLANSDESLRLLIETKDRSVAQRLAADSASLSDHFERLRSGLKRDVSGLERRLEMTEGGLAKLAEMRLGSARALALAEAEYLLGLANERLQLFADPAAALKALKLAAAQLGALNDPVFNSVRQALATEIQALESVETPDRMVISGRLLALARAASQWPLDSRRSLQADGQNLLQPDQDEQGWWPRLRGLLSNAVTVQREQTTVIALLSLGDERLLRENLRLQLQLAQLAALRAEQTLYIDALALVSQWLREYYDREAVAVENALQALEELGQIDLDPEMPPITTALRLLRNLNSAFELELEPGFEPASTSRDETP